ncbi:MAG: tetratricopeptide repeat protein [Anaerolineaceae bacterium]
MSDKQGQEKQTSKPGSEQAAIWEMVEQTTIARAADLARSGKYKEAERSLLEAMRSGKATPTLLDLLARIYAQQELWDKAESVWKQALQLDPENISYIEALKRVAKMRRWHLPRNLVFIVGLLLLFSACLVVGKLLFFSPHPATVTETIPPIGETVAPLPLVTPTQTQALLPGQTQIPELTPTVIPLPTPITCKITVGFNSGTINVRTGPNINFPSVGWLSENDQVVILGGLDFQAVTGWIYILREPDLKGWINASYCQ